MKTAWCRCGYFRGRQERRASRKIKRLAIEELVPPGLPISKTFVSLSPPPKGRLAPSAPEDFEMADLDDLNRNIMLGNLGKLAQLQQQREQLELLEKHERQRRGVCRCPHCGGGIPQEGVAVCMHCRRDLHWHKGFCGASIEQARQEQQRVSEGQQRVSEERQRVSALRRKAREWDASSEGRESFKKSWLAFFLLFFGFFATLAGFLFAVKGLFAFDETYPLLSPFRFAALAWFLGGARACRTGASLIPHIKPNPYQK